jgi:hypothetical protein
MGQRAVGRKRRYKKDNNIYCAKLFKGTACENVEIQIIFGSTTVNLRDHKKTYIKYFQFPTGRCSCISKCSLWFECIIQ